MAIPAITPTSLLPVDTLIITNMSKKVSKNSIMKVCMGLKFSTGMVLPKN